MDDFTGSQRKRPHRAQRINYRALNDGINEEVPPEDRIIEFPSKRARNSVEPITPDDSASQLTCARSPLPLAYPQNEQPDDGLTDGEGCGILKEAKGQSKIGRYAANDAIGRRPIPNQRQRQLPAVPLHVNGATVAPAPEVKILGVILDQGLRFKSHIGKAANKEMKAVLALRRLRGLPPSVARQLFTSTVASKIDYAASVWCPLRQDYSVAAGIVRPFEAIQRVASQAIVGVFRNTALAIAEAEAGIEPTVVRLRARILKHWIVCHTLPKDHLFWSCRAAAAMQDGSYPSPFKILAKYGPHCLSDMEVIRPFPLDPWQRSLSELIATVGSDMHELHEAGHARLWLFISVSVRNGLVGAGLVVRVNQVDIASSNRTVGSDDALNAHYAQLGVVLEAVSYIRTLLPRIQMSPWKIHITIVVNNPAVLLSLAKPHLQGGQALITLITEEIIQLSEMGAKVNLQPPTEEDNEHTARTHSLAREATVENSEVNPPPWARTQLRAVDGTSEPNGRAWKPDIKIVKAVIAFAMATQRLLVEG
ncbi:hypothetical protein N7505_001440 [Penicillium chrysogenum]|uniref:Reverse transcriptase n=1 Tax=Penicillium chrysogenum TaxID=5076 RepID=A0ABQ8WXV0_PENCH|nr:hypothetical protein N7505_001440 [Penicillium chrysogenum]